MDLDISGDFSIVDNLETVMVTAKDGSYENAASSFSTPIRTREIEASNGRYTAGDLRFHIPIVNTTKAPQVGGTIALGCSIYSIIDVERTQMSGVFRCGSRRLDIFEELDTLIDIQRATWSKNSNGVQVATWSIEASAVRAKIQPATESLEQDEGARNMRKRFVVFLDRDRAIDHDRRILGIDGSIYKILSYAKRERLDVLPSVLVELLS